MAYEKAILNLLFVQFWKISRPLCGKIFKMPRNSQHRDIVNADHNSHVVIDVPVAVPSASFPDP